VYTGKIAAFSPKNYILAIFGHFLDFSRGEKENEAMNILIVEDDAKPPISSSGHFARTVSRPLSRTTAKRRWRA
jgi:hypothetical protein